MGGRRGKGEGSIYKRDDGVWIAAVDLGWSGGKRSRRFVNGRTCAEVVKRLNDLQSHAERGLAMAPERLTVGEYLDHWVATRVPVEVRDKDDGRRGRVRTAVHEPSRDRAAADLTATPTLGSHGMEARRHVGPPSPPSPRARPHPRLPGPAHHEVTSLLDDVREPARSPRRVPSKTEPRGPDRGEFQLRGSRLRRP
jgi:hypothetical protein